VVVWAVEFCAVMDRVYFMSAIIEAMLLVNSWRSSRLRSVLVNPRYGRLPLFLRYIGLTGDGERVRDGGSLVSRAGLCRAEVVSRGEPSHCGEAARPLSEV